MRLAPLYQEEREQLLTQGIEQGERAIIENMMRLRFGELDEILIGIIDRLLTLPPEELTPLVMQLSRQELIDRFG